MDKGESFQLTSLSYLKNDREKDSSIIIKTEIDLGEDFIISPNNKEQTGEKLHYSSIKIEDTNSPNVGIKEEFPENGLLSQERLNNTDDDTITSSFGTIKKEEQDDEDYLPETVKSEEDDDKDEDWQIFPTKRNKAQQKAKNDSPKMKRKKPRVYQKKYPCKFCPYKSRSEHYLKIHTRMHTGEKPFSCTKCPKTFSLKQSLNNHLNYFHSPVSLHKCSLCERTFKFKCSVKSHLISIHYKYKPFECPDCDMTFPRKSQLRSHSLTHAGKMRYKCYFCDEEFLHRDRHQNHIRRKHIFEKPNKCKICKLRFFCYRVLKTHVETTHNPQKPYEFECSLCQKKFRLIDYLRAHMRQHEDLSTRIKYNCYFCSKPFEHKGPYHDHLSLHTLEKAITCCWCTVRFRIRESFTVHFRNHTQEKPYFCKIKQCKRSFKQGAHLRRHIRDNHTRYSEF